jgi:hypothetical protein
MSSSVTHKRLFQNTGTLERSKIGKSCLVSCECVEETRARQIRRYARALEVCSALLGRRMVRKENEKDPNGRDERVGRSSWCCCGCGSRGQPSAITAVIPPFQRPPSCARPLISFLPSKFSSHPSLFLWLNSFHVPPLPPLLSYLHPRLNDAVSSENPLTIDGDCIPLIFLFRTPRKCSLDTDITTSFFMVVAIFPRRRHLSIWLHRPD